VEVDEQGVVHDVHAGDLAEAGPILSALHHTNVHDHGGRHVPQRFIEEGMVRVRRVVSTGVPEAYEQRIGTNGSARDFDIRIAPMSPTRALVSISEITERRASQWVTARMIGRAQVDFAASVEKCVCQDLADLSQLAAKLASDLPQVMGRASQLAERVDEMLAKSRGMVSSLSPTRLETDGLLPALLDLAKHLQATAQIDCVVEHSGLLPRDYFVSLQLFRIARETVETMVRHTLPRKVRIGVHAQQGLTILRVEAEGSRPLEGSREAAETSLGMLQVQASTIGAALELREKDGLQGVVCRVPTVD
jgi:hypothetical protein